MTTTDIPSTTPDDGEIGAEAIEGEAIDADAFANRVFAAILGAQEVQAIYLGDRLGWYGALAANGPLTAGELAAHTGTAERYAREWLEHQAVAGYLAVDDVTAPSTERRFALPAAQARVLDDIDSLLYLTPIANFVAATGRHLDQLLEAYRAGTGVTWAEQGRQAREAQAAANRPLLLHQLCQELLPSVPDLHERMRSATRIADIGCGYGWSAIGIALAHPHVRVDGFDVDEPSIEAARANAAAAGVADRVSFHVGDASRVGDPGGADQPAYDVVFAFECIHDLPDPVAVLGGMRQLAGGTGTVVVVDERAADRFTAPGDEVERLLYGYSLMCCLPDGLAHQPTVGTGTVMRTETLASYARAAGFVGVEVLPIEHDFFRFYRLH